MIHRFERFCGAVTEITRCWHKLAAEEMEKYGLSGPHAVYLTTLYQYTEGITSAKLSEICGKNKSDVSRMVAVLERRGLVKRVHVHKNFYRALLKLTEEGRTAAEQVEAKVAVAVEYIGRGITDENREICYKVLEHISGNMQILCEEGLPQKHI